MDGSNSLLMLILDLDANAAKESIFERGLS